MNTLVSIIIPTYNRAHLICETLDSIIAQTYQDWECIVVDDGSTDKTEILINSYIKIDSRFQYHKRPEHKPKGANACRNYGFELSKGSFINWFDSDDIMLPNKLKLQVKALSEQKDFPYCICQSLWFDNTTNSSLGLRSKSIYSDNRFEDYCLQKVFWLTTAPLWRKTFLMENELSFDESLHQSQEYDFHIKALSISDNYAVIIEPLVTIMKHSESISHNIYSSDLKLASNLKVKKLLFDSYSHKLSRKGKLKLHESLTLMFKALLILKNFKQARHFKEVLINTLNYLELSFLKKFIFKIKLTIVFISYRIFGVGYKLIRALK